MAAHAESTADLFLRDPDGNTDDDTNGESASSVLQPLGAGGGSQQNEGFFVAIGVDPRATQKSEYSRVPVSSIETRAGMHNSGTAPRNPPGPFQADRKQHPSTPRELRSVGDRDLTQWIRHLHELGAGTTESAGVPSALGRRGNRARIFPIASEISSTESSRRDRRLDAQPTHTASSVFAS